MPAGDSNAAGGASAKTPTDASGGGSTQLGIPTLGAAGASDSAITLSYTAPAGSNLELEQKGPGDANFHVARGLSAPSGGQPGSVDISGLAPASDYSFRVRADLGGIAAYSKELDKSTLDPSATLPTPDAPVFDSNQPRAANASYHITWNWSGSSVQFGIFQGEARGVDSNGDPFLGLTPSANVFEDMQTYFQGPPPFTGQFAGRLLPANPDTAYQVRVRASADGQHSNWSDWTSYKTPGTVPDAPSGLGATDNGNGTLTLTWAPSDNVGSGAEFSDLGSIVIGLDGAGKFVAANPGAPGQTITADPRVAKYVVRTSGSKSDELLATSLQSSAVDNPYYNPTVAPDAPTGLTATPYADSTGSGVHLLWDNTPNNEDGFALQWSADSGSDDQKTWHSLEGSDDTPTTTGADETQYDDTADHGVTGSISYRVGSFTGNTDNISWAQSITLGVAALSTISVSAINANAAFDGPDGKPQGGWLDFHRNGATGHPLTANVNYDNSTAVSGTDYSGNLPTQITFAEGEEDFVVPIIPANGSISAGTTVAASITAGSGYTFNPACAQINLAAHGLAIELVYTSGGTSTDGYDDLIDSANGENNLQELKLTLPTNAVPGATFTLTIDPRPDTDTASLVDVWTTNNPGIGETPLLGNGKASYTWTVAADGTGTPPSVLYVGAIAASRVHGDLVFSISETDPTGTADPSTQPATAIAFPLPESKSGPPAYAIGWIENSPGQTLLNFVANPAPPTGFNGNGLSKLSWFTQQKEYRDILYLRPTIWVNSKGIITDAYATNTQDVGYTKTTVFPGATLDFQGAGELVPLKTTYSADHKSVTLTSVAKFRVNQFENFGNLAVHLFTNISLAHRLAWAWQVISYTMNFDGTYSVKFGTSYVPSEAFYVNDVEVESVSMAARHNRLSAFLLASVNTYGPGEFDGTLHVTNPQALP